MSDTDIAKSVTDAMRNVENRRALIADVDLPSEYARVALDIFNEAILEARATELLSAAELVAPHDKKLLTVLAAKIIEGVR